MRKVNNLGRARRGDCGAL